ncbi:hypothetical protein U1Q18_005506 [Sarracenia purpurea var. burkii]
MPLGSAAGWFMGVFALVVEWGVVASAGELSGGNVVFPASAIIPQAQFGSWVLSWVEGPWVFLFELLFAGAIPSVKSFGTGPWCRVGRLFYNLLFGILPHVSCWMSLSCWFLLGVGCAQFVWYGFPGGLDLLPTAFCLSFLISAVWVWFKQLGLALNRFKLKNAVMLLEANHGFAFKPCPSLLSFF